MADAIAAAIKPLGFRWVCLDLEGYRMGSLNEVLNVKSGPSSGAASD
jgi:PP-loop superfamily ATP-utilizing enzyme